jgi:hypothetical protein
METTPHDVEVMVYKAKWAQEVYETLDWLIADGYIIDLQLEQLLIDYDDIR